MPELDPILRLLLLLKNNWNLTGDFTGSNLTFTTRWYDENIMFPQITITPLGSTETLLTTGDQPIYRFGDAVGINIWVRPKQDSNASIGWAKNAVYQLRKEADRILMTGSRLATPKDHGNYIYEYYNTGDNLYDAVYAALWRAQTFTIGATGHRVTSVKLKLYRVGSPGTVTVGIRATDGSGHPTGSDLTSGTVDGNTLTDDGNGAWYEIILTPYIVSANTKYAIAVRAPNGNVSNNFVEWKVDWSDATYTGGNEEWSSNSGVAWSSDSTNDMMFEVYETNYKSEYEQFVSLGGWRQLDELDRRPAVFRIQKTVVVNYFRDQVVS